LQQGLAERSEYLGCDLVDRTNTGNGAVLRRAFSGGELLVEVHQRLGLRVVDRQAMTHGFFFVVVALDQRFAGFVVNTGDFRRIVFGVVDATRGRVHAATGDAADDFFVVHSDLDHVVDDYASFLQGFSLRNGAWKTIEEETIGAISLGDAFLDKIDDQVIGNQTTAVHYAFGNQAQFSAGLDRST